MSTKLNIINLHSQDHPLEPTHLPLLYLHLVLHPHTIMNRIDCQAEDNVNIGRDELINMLGLKVTDRMPPASGKTVNS